MCIIVAMSCLFAFPLVEAKPTNVTKVCVLFFDDGWQNAYTVAMPVLEKYHFNATFGIITGFIGAEQGTEWARLTNAQIVKMSSKGFEIASHSVTHPYLTQLTYEQRMQELVDSKMTLESLIDKPVRNFIVPYSDDNAEVDANILSVYSHFRSYENVLFIGSENLKTFQREVSAKGNFVMICYHQLRKASGDYITSPNLFNDEMEWLHYKKYQVISFDQLWSLQMRNINE